MASSRISKQQVGIAGEYYVAAMLSLRGFNAAITLRNTEGYDILADHPDSGKTVKVSVKSIWKGNSWVMSKKYEDIKDADLYYVFVDFNGDVQKNPTCHVIQSDSVAKRITEDHQTWLAGKGKKGQKRKDNPLRRFYLTENDSLENWDELLR